MKYKIIPRLNPQKPNDNPKYFARIVRPENITLEKLSKRIAEISPLSEIDTQTTLIALTKVLPEFFIEGATVELGDFGYFQTTMQSNGVENTEDFTANQIKGFSVRYRASNKVKEQCRLVKYTKVIG